MKEKFLGFYNNDDQALEKIWKAQDTLFIFDTNTLLNIYSYAEQTRDDLFSLLKKIEKRLWIPHHVGLEYQIKRLDVIKNEKNIFTRIEDNLKKIEQVFEKDFKELALSRRFPEIEQETQTLRRSIARQLVKYRKSVKSWDDKQPCVRTHDKIRDQLDKLFHGRIGPIPSTQGWLDTVFKEGADRYKRKVPPGYEDKEKEKDPNNEYCFAGLNYQRQYGDLIIWKQIIEHCKEKAVKSVILITDDQKEDWWKIINSRGSKTIGPRPELVEEIMREAEVDLFQMYSNADFLELGGKKLHVDVRKESISDAASATATATSQYLDVYFPPSATRQLEKFINDSYSEKIKDALNTQKIWQNHISTTSALENYENLLNYAKSHESAQETLERLRKIQSLYNTYTSNKIYPSDTQSIDDSKPQNSESSSENDQGEPE